MACLGSFASKSLRQDGFALPDLAALYGIGRRKVILCLPVTKYRKTNIAVTAISVVRPVGGIAD